MAINSVLLQGRTRLVKAAVGTHHDFPGEPFTYFEIVFPLPHGHSAGIDVRAHGDLAEKVVKRGNDQLVNVTGSLRRRLQDDLRQRPGLTELYGEPFILAKHIDYQRGE